MNNERISSRLSRLISAFLAPSMVAVLLVSSPVGAADRGATETSLTDAVAVEHAVEHAGDSERLSPFRTTTGSVIERPDFAFTACPEITDSVMRLYSAYFLRAPDQGGFEFWLNEYSAGNWSLPRMSTFFSQSPEFEELYGGITDAEFIDLIYVNIFGRVADEGGRNYWLGRMQNEGLDRGTVMLFFSESPEYVDLTLTSRPLAGDFNWYPEGTSWDCGFGFTEFEIPASGTFLDLGIYNNARRPIEFSVNQRRNGAWENAVSDSLEPGVFYIFFGVPLDNTVIERVQVGGNSEDLIWTVVLSPEPTPRERAGWVAI